MSQTKAMVRVNKIDQGRLFATLQFNIKMPQKGEWCVVKWGKKRSNLQNNLYWLYLEFLMNDCGLKDEYLTTDDLHETFKATFLSKRIFKNGLEIIKVGSTTELDKISFGEYIDKIDKAMATYYQIDTSSFWDEVKERGEWK